MVRPATRDDILTLVELGRRFHNETIMASIVAFDETAVTHLISSLIDSPEAHITILERNGARIGGFIGIKAPTWFNPQVAMAQQLCWYVAPEYRTREATRMLHGFRRWARSVGAVWVATGFKSTERYQGMADLLGRNGWVPLEQHWIREA